MERVAFLIEGAGTHISCLLNPASMTFTRSAGVRGRALDGGVILGRAGADEPVIADGGGVTEFELELLFDTELAETLNPRPSLLAPERCDVRDWTRPIWALSEPQARYSGATPAIRFIWGRAWNVPAVITDLAERLERFSPSGAPTRSWLSLRLRQTPEPAFAAPLGSQMSFSSQTPFAAQSDGVTSQAPGSPSQTALAAQTFGVPGAAGAHNVGYIEASADSAHPPTTPLCQIAAQTTSDPGAWREIAAASGIDDPLRIAPGRILTFPTQTAPR